MCYFAACAPPVGLYDPKHADKVQAAIINSGDDRFKEPRCNSILYYLLSVLDKEMCMTAENNTLHVI